MNQAVFVPYSKIAIGLFNLVRQAILKLNFSICGINHSEDLMNISKFPQTVLLNLIERRSKRE